MTQTNLGPVSSTKPAAFHKRIVRVTPKSILFVILIHAIGAAVGAGLTAIGAVVAFASDGGGVGWLFGVAWYTAIWGPGAVYLIGVGWTIWGIKTGRRGWVRALATIAAMILVTTLSFVAAIIGARA